MFLKDVGHVRFGYEKPFAAMLHRGEKGITVGIQAEPGTNVLELTDPVLQRRKQARGGRA